MRRVLSAPLLLLVTVGLAVAWPVTALAGPASSNYELQQYSFGSGGSSTDMSSPNNSLFGNTGEVEFDPSSPNYTFAGGLNYQLQTPTPLGGTLSNPYQFYDRLKYVINPGTDPSTTTYLIALSPDNFTTTYYVTPSLTLSTTFSASDYQDYATWGGASGVIVTGLEMNTTYTAKVKATQGAYTESDWSATSSALTDLPNLTLTLSGAVDMGVWNEANNYASTATSTVTTSTNAYNGYSVYAYETGSLQRQNGSETIPNYSGTYLSPKSWLSGQGFGYTTTDTDIGGVAKWNANPCPGDNGSPLCYAAFAVSGPGDVVADHETNLSSGPVTSENFTVTYKTVTNATQVAGQYLTTIVYTVTPVY